MPRDSSQAAFFLDRRQFAVLATLNVGDVLKAFPIAAPYQSDRFGGVAKGLPVTILLGGVGPPPARVDDVGGVRVGSAIRQLGVVKAEFDLGFALGVQLLLDRYRPPTVENTGLEAGFE